jgi:hypothetical protein
MHEAVGRAVLFAQVFETMVSICFQLLGMLETGTSTLIDSTHFKVPTRNLVKALAQDNNIAPEFEDQINDLIEKRHQLVHRWYQENGLPSEEDTAHIAKLIELAFEVEQNSKRISGLLAGYIVRWGRMHPEQNVRADPERSRLLALFQRAHLGDTGE